jgi:hypothetical protein
MPSEPCNDAIHFSSGNRRSDSPYSYSVNLPLVFTLIFVIFLLVLTWSTRGFPNLACRRDTREFYAPGNRFSVTP